MIAENEDKPPKKDLMGPEFPDVPAVPPHQRVRALLVAKNIKQKDIARQYFISPPELNRVLMGKRRTKHIRKAIAMALGMTVEEIWHDEHSGESAKMPDVKP